MFLRNLDIFTPPRNRNNFTSVCLSVCVCVCVSVNEIPVERMHRFERGFRYTATYRTGSDPIEIDLGSKVKVTMTQYLLFRHNSLFTFLLNILALFCLIKLKFGMQLTYTLRRFVCEIH